MKDNLKALNEQKATNEKEMESLLNKVKFEERAFTEEENTRFTELENNMKLILNTLKAIEDNRELTDEVKEKTPEEEEMDKEERTMQERAIAEEKAFESYVRGTVNERAEVNMTTTDNGAVIPTSIANKIISRVVEISPIFQKSDRYNVSGNLTIPYYDETSQSITCDYADEFTELESKAGKMKNIDLKGYLAGALTKVAKSLVNNSKFDIVDFVINKMAQAIALWIEKELIHGTDDKILGLRGINQVVTTGSSSVITADDLIDVQDKVPDIYQKDAFFVMNKATRTAIRKLKDANGNYLMNKDMTSAFGYTLLGKDVYCTDNADKIGAGKDVIFYGDFSGLATKVSENVSIEVLREKFATQHAIGVIGYVEIDAKIQDVQKLAKLKMGA